MPCPRHLARPRRREFAALAARAGSNPSLLVAGIVAGPFLGAPCRMLTNPLGDIGLRGHHALLGRTVPVELKVLFLAIGGIGDGADGQDDFYQAALHAKCGLAIIRPIYLHVSEFRQESPVWLCRKMLAPRERLRSVGEHLCRIAKLRRRSSLRHFETSGLDIRRKRAMFREYIMTCSGLQRVVSALRCQRKGLASGPVYPADPMDFQKP